jgi:hypothetical protein
MVGGPFKLGCNSISFETDSMIERVYELRMGITRERTERKLTACLIEKEARVTCVDAPMVSSRVLAIPLANRETRTNLKRIRVVLK